MLASSVGPELSFGRLAHGELDQAVVEEGLAQLAGGTHGNAVVEAQRAGQLGLEEIAQLQPAQGITVVVGRWLGARAPRARPGRRAAGDRQSATGACCVP